MRVLRVALVVAAALCGAAVSQPSQPPQPGGRGGGGRGAAVLMTLTSSAWTAGGQIPRKYTQPGGEASPPLAWTNAPDNVSTFVLLVHDPDTPTGNGTDDTLHWLVWNIPASVHELADDASRAGLPQGALQISATAPSYRGPGAAAAGPAHHYTFEIFALDTQLDVPPGTTAPAQIRAAVMAGMAGHVRGKGVLVGLFKR
jgi:Raf kinase inhibitor-like YbhB/YbcL family protein